MSEQADLKRRANLEREDLITFLNAAKVCTGQSEFYGDSRGQAVSVDFLHDYVMTNYRQLYARTVAADINDFNTARVVTNLLRFPHPDLAQRRAEGELIAAALHTMPPQRSYRVLARLREHGICNRRTKKIVRDYLETRPDPKFHALKYRHQIKQLVRHFHLRTPGDTGKFLFHGHRAKSYDTELFETFRRAHYNANAIYELPYTVAEGLATRTGVDRQKFLEKIAPKLTHRERVRLQQSGAGIRGVELDDLGMIDLTRLAFYLLSRPPAERREKAEQYESALVRSAARAARRTPLQLGHVHVVLDNSYSTTGTRETHNRPLALAVAAYYLLQQCTEKFRVHWVTPVSNPLLAVPRGHTNLATPILQALAEKPDMVLVLSDGRDNDPPGGAAQVVHAFRQRLDPERRTPLFHLNPTFDASSYGTEGIHADMPMLGIRRAEEIPTMLAFARFVDGSADLEELEDYLHTRAQQFVANAKEAVA